MGRWSQVEPSPGRTRGVLLTGLVAALVAFGSLASCTVPEQVTPSPSPSPSPTSLATADPLPGFPAPFPTGALSQVSADALPPATAEVLQGILDAATPDGGSRGGFTAVVLDAARGTWAGAAGTADGTSALTPAHAMSLGDLTQTVVAAQVMWLVERGLVDLDAPAADYLPADLPFDVNGASVRQLLGMRSGIPHHLSAPEISLALRADRTRHWTPRELLAVVPERRDPAGGPVAYSATNYLILGVLIESVTGVPLADALRSGVLDHPGLERLAVQPDEPPADPVALPFGTGTDPNQFVPAEGGFLPSVAEVSAAAGSGNLAGDAPALARWWQLLCGGQVISRTSLTEMADFRHGQDAGLGFARFRAPGGAPIVGAFSSGPGYGAIAACLPVDGIVVVAVTNNNAQLRRNEVFDAMLVAVTNRA